MTRREPHADRRLRTSWRDQVAHRDLPQPSTEQRARVIEAARRHISQSVPHGTSRAKIPARPLPWRRAAVWGLVPLASLALILWWTASMHTPASDGPTPTPHQAYDEAWNGESLDRRIARTILATVKAQSASATDRTYRASRPTAPEAADAPSRPTDTLDGRLERLRRTTRGLHGALLSGHDPAARTGATGPETASFVRTI